MKKMKKSKVIVPALGLLLLSTAASVTGTVAWFTANKSITATAGNFAVASTTGDLEIAATAGVGVTADSTTAAISPLETDSKAAVLADASYDHASDTVYKPIKNATEVEAYTTLAAAATGDTYLRQTVNGVKKHSAFTWKYTFKFTPEANDIQIGLFLDKTASSVEDQDKTNASNSYKGFRLAFIANDTAATKTVWADDRTAAECQYVSGAGSLNGGTPEATISSYTGAVLLASDTTASVPADNASTEAQCQAMANFLGSFGTTRDADGKVSIEIRCVAWFEGTDADVDTDAIDETATGNKLDAVLATMKFTAVNFAA